MALRKRPYQTKQEWVRAEIKRAIQIGEFAPGTRLIMDELAAEYGVSRVPVREALLQLGMEGLVKIEPHRGASVAAVSPELMSELQEVGQALDVIAIGHLSGRPSPRRLRILEGLLKRMDKAAAQDNVLEWADLDQEFHLAITEVSGMTFVPDLQNRIGEHWYRLVRFNFPEVLRDRFQKTRGEHEAIVAALQRGDVEAAKEACLYHRRSVSADYLKSWSDRKHNRSPRQVEGEGSPEDRGRLHDGAKDST